MCTVSFYPDNSKVIITSNIDEHINRPLAIAPKRESYGAKTLYYPKDPLSLSVSTNFHISYPKATLTKDKTFKSALTDFK